MINLIWSKKIRLRGCNLDGAILKNKNLIFWDFDGVIKDSVDVKTVAYERLFLSFGVDIAERVRRHHEANCGVSRLDKIPLYLEWARQPASQTLIEEFCHYFSEAVINAVINSPWVPGAREYLLKYYRDKYFVLLTATPQDEIEQILKSIELSHCFKEIFGAPTEKEQAIKVILDRLNFPSENALMIGDSESDLFAAKANGVPFFLRRTILNVAFQSTFQGTMFDDFINE
jgi:phosphoglycolate phosphatase-like HAD superfamily hydrolase